MSRSGAPGAEKRRPAAAIEIVAESPKRHWTTWLTPRPTSLVQYACGTAFGLDWTKNPAEVTCKTCLRVMGKEGRC